MVASRADAGPIITAWVRRLLRARAREIIGLFGYTENLSKLYRLDHFNHWRTLSRILGREGASFFASADALSCAQ